MTTTLGRLADGAPEHADTPILAKPFSKEDLAMKVREVLDGGTVSVKR